MGNTYTTLLQQAERLKKHNRQSSYKTRARYFEAYKRFLYFAGEKFRLQRIANTHPKHLKAYVLWMQQKGLSPSTIKTDLSAIRFWHDQIPNVKYTLPENSELGLERRKFGGVDRTWTQGEFNRMILQCWKEGQENYAAAITIAYYVGLRIHEVMRIDTAIARKAAKTGIITIKGKGGRIRDVRINEPVKVILTEYLRKTKPGHKLFVPDGVGTDVVIHKLQEFIRLHRAEVFEQDSEVLKTFHGLRHTYAANQYGKCRQAGKTDLGAKLAVSKSIGHNRPDVTNIYLAGVKRKKQRDENNE